jgi:hypothetical protein
MPTGREQEQPGDEDPSALEQVAGSPAEQQQAAERHRVGVREPLQVRPGEPERGLDVWQGDVDDGQVERDHQLGCRDDGQYRAKPPRHLGRGRGPGFRDSRTSLRCSAWHENLPPSALVEQASPGRW